MLTALGKELFDALHQGSACIKHIIQLVRRDPTLLQEQDTEGRTPLHLAVEKRYYTGLLHFLLDQNADPNARDIENRTPLFLAVQLHYTEIVNTLLSRGAQANVIDNQGVHILQKAISEPRVDFNPKIVGALLKADVNPRVPSSYKGVSVGVVVFCAAINKGNAAFVQLLLDYSVDLRLVNADPAQLSCYIGLKKAAYFLRTGKQATNRMLSPEVFRARLLEIIALSFASAYIESVQLGLFNLGMWVCLTPAEQYYIKNHLYYILAEKILEKAILHECVLKSSWHQRRMSDAILASRLFARCSDNQIIDLVSYSAVCGVGAVAIYPMMLASHPMRSLYDDTQLEMSYTTLFYIVQQYANQVPTVDRVLANIREDRQYALTHAAFITEALFEKHIASAEPPTFNQSPRVMR